MCILVYTKHYHGLFSAVIGPLVELGGYFWRIVSLHPRQLSELSSVPTITELRCRCRVLAIISVSLTITTLKRISTDYHYLNCRCNQLLTSSASSSEVSARQPIPSWRCRALEPPFMWDNILLPRSSDMIHTA